MVQVVKKDEVEDVTSLLTNQNFYNISYNPGNKDYSNNIYVNGILANVSFNLYD